jgi:hypothetical protein
MVTGTPGAKLDQRYSSSEAAATPWESARRVLEQAQLYWLSSVRPGGSPHVTPLIAVSLDGALHFCTGADERKAKNLALNDQCVVTTGCNSIEEGLDIVVEGRAERVRGEGELARIAAAYVEKYGEEWRFAVRDGAFVGTDGNVAIVFRVAPVQVFGFAKDPYGQTRWRF